MNAIEEIKFVNLEEGWENLLAVGPHHKENIDRGPA